MAEILRKNLYTNCLISSDFPMDLKVLLDGKKFGLTLFNEPIKEKPEWLDMEKFKIGQKFAIDHYFSINFAEMISLYFLFSFPGNLCPLIYTKKSHTPYAAFKRYLSTVKRVKSWYEGNIWDPEDPACKNLKVVRALHSNIDSEMRSLSKDDLVKRCNLESIITPNILLSPSNKILSRDFGIPDNCPIQWEFDIETDSFLNQWTMSLTQFGFMGLIVLSPEKFGISKFSKENMEGFIHFWRVLGYLLGIDDKYNFCKGSLSDVQKRCTEMSEILIKPQLKSVTQQWEHMSRCMVEGISFFITNLTFETSFLYLCWVLNIDTPEFYKSLTWKQKFFFYLIKFTLTVVLKIQGVFSIYNWLLNKAIQKISNASSENLQQFANRKYDFQTVFHNLSEYN